MAELRLVLTVLPVGPRGKDTVTSGATRMFALQIAAGFDTRDASPPSADLIKSLWPWTLNGGTKKVRIALVTNGATVSHEDVDVTLPAVTAFGQNLRDRIHGQYAGEGARKPLDVRWRFPGESGQIVADDESFPARAKYLATLPSDLSRQLFATIDVPIKIDTLFTFDINGNATPKADAVFLAPVTVVTPQGTSEIAENPKKLAANAQLLRAAYADAGSLAVGAFSPGFELKRLVAPASASAVFDLTKYWTRVDAGDARLTRLEDLLESALDPFAELDAVPVPLVRDGFTIKRGTFTEPMPPEVADALTELWRAHALVDQLSKVAVEDIILRLARALLDRDEDLAFLKTALTAAHFLEAPGTADDVFDRVARLAAVLRIQDGTFRVVLTLVAMRAGFAAAAVWIASVMTDVLATAVETNANRDVLNRLRNAWRFVPEAGADADQQQTAAARRLAIAEIVVRARFEATAVRELMGTLATRPADGKPAAEFLRGKALELLKARWPKRVAALFSQTVSAPKLGLPMTIDAIQPVDDPAPVLAARRLDEAWPVAPPVQRNLPGHGLALRLGKPEHQLAHEPAQGSSVAGSPYSEVAGLAVFARRGRTKADVETRPWRLVSGGACVIGSLDDTFFTPEVSQDQWLDRLLAIPYRPVFQQKVTRADTTYYGEPLSTRDPLDRGYADGEASGGPLVFGSAYTFEALGAFREHASLAVAAKVSAASITRYGDWYQFAAGVIDQAGGLPPQIAVAATPWQVDAKAIDVLTAALPECSPPLVFPRTVAVGELTIALLRAKGEPSWPALPEDVTLRGREWWSALHPTTDQAPSLLLSAFSDAAPASRTLHVLPPSIEEHTLVPWAAPDLSLAEQPASEAKEAVIKGYTKLLADRRKLGAQLRPQAQPSPPTPVELFHDPAVTHIGIAVRGATAEGTVVEVFRKAIKLEPAAMFRQQPVEIEVKAVDALPAGGTFPVPVQSGQRVDVKVPAGCFAIVDASPLVTNGDFTRFADAVVFDDLLQPADAWAGFRAFRSSSVLVETAIDALPDVDELFKGMALDELATEAVGTLAPATRPVLGGPVSVQFTAQAGLRHLAFVDTFTLRRERWVWRNRPTLVRTQVNAAKDDERRRLLASGLPKDAFDPERRDTSDDVVDWEAVARPDRGFVSRGDYRQRWPRQAPASALETGGPQREALLLLDNRDEVSAADYLRYSLTVRSRYAGILDERRRETTATALLRIVTRSRAERLKPPKVLAVIPLTRSFDPLSDPDTEKKDGKTPARTTPLLVILDEVWFREYGVGERLQVRVALESLDLGEKDESPGRPYRVGPLPDHYLAVPASGDPYAKERYFLKSLRTSKEDDAAPLVLDAFGPFGFSLDVSPDEALANASAFSVSLLETIGPHWSATVRLARVLEHPASASDPSTRLERVSALSDAHQVYSLPDSTTLAQVRPKHSPVTAQSKAEGKGSVTINDGVTWTLDPATLPNDPQATVKNKNSAAVSRYRYFLMISKLAYSASNADPVEIPQAMWRMLPLGAPNGFVEPGTKNVVFGKGTTCEAEQLGGGVTLSGDAQYVGRVIEVLVNGHYPGPSRLDRRLGEERNEVIELTLRSFWTSLLGAAGEADSGHDAAGMIRRVSDAFGLGLAKA